MLDFILYVIAFLGMFSITLAGFSILLVCLSRKIDKVHRDKFISTLRQKTWDEDNSQ